MREQELMLRHATALPVPRGTQGLPKFAPFHPIGPAVRFGHDGDHGSGMSSYSKFGQELVPKKISDRQKHGLLWIDLTVKNNKGVFSRLCNASNKIAMPSPRC